ADWLDPVPSIAGLHLCALLRPEVSADLDRVLDRARESGVAAESLAAYCAGERPRAGLVLGYGAIRAEQVAEGLRLLGRCLESLAERKPGAAPVGQEGRSTSSRGPRFN
ncbi:hypothetical protein AB0P04_43590, partial [Streptomyces anulatus]